MIPGLPAIPTAISLGLINDQYGTTAQYVIEIN